MTVTFYKNAGPGGTSGPPRCLVYVPVLLAALAAVFLAGLFFAAPAHALTLVDADITEETTWKTVYSPYIICQKAGGGEPEVASGITLTIEEGVEVQLGQGTISKETGDGQTVPRYVAEALHVKGTLAAAGVTFTAFDGAGSPTPPFWSALRFYHNSFGLFSSCEFVYGGAGATAYGMLTVDDPAVKVNITIIGGKFAHGAASATAQAGGIYFRAGSGSSLTVDGTTFTDLGQSVCVHRDTANDADITIKNCEIFNVATRQDDWAVMSVRGGTAAVENCRFHNNGTNNNTDLDTRDEWTHNGPYRLTLRNNQFNGGNMARHPLVLAARSQINQNIDNPQNTFTNYPESHKWAPIGGIVPAGVEAYWGDTGLDYVITHETYVLANQSGIGSLTVAPGQNVLFKSYSLILFGSLSARGTEAKPITFASYPGQGSTASIANLSGSFQGSVFRGSLFFEHCVFDGLLNGIRLYDINRASLLPGDDVRLEIRNCVFKNVFQNPILIYGDAYDQNNALIDHCLIYKTISKNFSMGYGYGLYFKGYSTNNLCSPRVTSTTIAYNSLGGAYLEYSDASFSNCIIFGNGTTQIPRALVNVNSTPSVAYSCVQEDFSGEGNISSDPLFADPDSGDFHLKSQAGRWYPSATGGFGGWVTDEATSPCIDAGDPASDYTKEPQPNGGRINMGFYGNTRYASKSPNQQGGGGDGGDLTPPTVPSNLRASNCTISSISVSWDASSDASGIEGYIVEIKKSGGEFSEAGTTAQTFFNKDDLTPNTTYTFRVRAKDKAGNVSDWSQELKAATKSPPLELDVPGVVEVAVGTEARIPVNVKTTALNFSIFTVRYTLDPRAAEVVQVEVPALRSHKVFRWGNQIYVFADQFTGSQLSSGSSLFDLTVKVKQRGDWILSLAGSSGNTNPNNNLPELYHTVNQDITLRGISPPAGQTVALPVTIDAATGEALLTLTGENLGNTAKALLTDTKNNSWELPVSVDSTLVTARGTLPAGLYTLRLLSGAGGNPIVLNGLAVPPAVPLMYVERVDREAQIPGRQVTHVWRVKNDGTTDGAALISFLFPEFYDQPRPVLPTNARLIWSGNKLKHLGWPAYVAIPVPAGKTVKVAWSLRLPPESVRFGVYNPNAPVDLGDLVKLDVSVVGTFSQGKWDELKDSGNEEMVAAAEDLSIVTGSLSPICALSDRDLRSYFWQVYQVYPNLARRLYNEKELGLWSILQAAQE